MVITDMKVDDVIAHLSRAARLSPGADGSRFEVAESRYCALLQAARLLHSATADELRSLARTAQTVERGLEMYGFPLPTPGPMSSWIDRAGASSVRELRLGVSEFLQDTALPYSCRHSFLDTPTTTVRPVPVRWTATGKALMNGDVDVAIHNRSIIHQVTNTAGVRAYRPPLIVFQGHSLYIHRNLVDAALTSGTLREDERAEIEREWHARALPLLSQDRKARLLRAAAVGLREPVTIGVQALTDLEFFVTTTMNAWDVERGEHYEMRHGNAGTQRLVSGALNGYAAGLGEAAYLDGFASFIQPLIARGERSYAELDGLIARSDSVVTDADFELVLSAVFRVHTIVNALAEERDLVSLDVILKRVARVYRKLYPGCDVPTLTAEQLCDIVNSKYEVLITSVADAMVFFPTPERRAEITATLESFGGPDEHIVAKRRLLLDMLRLPERR